MDTRRSRISLLNPTGAKRLVQVVPVRSASQEQLLREQQHVHKWFLHFLDRELEKEYQKYFCQEKMHLLSFQMALLLATSIAIAICAAQENLSDSSKLILDQNGIAYSMKQTSRIHSTLFVAVATCCYLSAWALLMTPQRVLFERYFEGIETIHLMTFAFIQIVAAPAILVLGSCVHDQVDLQDQLPLSFAADQKTLLAIIGASYVDLLFFYVVVVLSIASCLLRIQTLWFLLLGAEALVLVVGFTVATMRTFSSPTHWAEAGVTLFLVLVLHHGVSVADALARQEFINSHNLLYENRRLSQLNTTMKADLSTNQLRYGMGDILSILCQIKLKMSTSDRKDIDRIITQLISNHDLFEVNLEETSEEHKEELQRWLQVMAFKEPLMESSHDNDPEDSTNGGTGGRKTSLKSKSITKHMLYTSRSRKMSNHEPHDHNKTIEMVTNINNFFKDLATERDEFTRWLSDALHNKFYVDIFYVDQHCHVPLQAVLIVCVQLNDFVNRLQLDLMKLREFAAVVETHYFKRNPYHNSLHAASVVADVNFFLTRLKLDVNDKAFFVGLIAASAHDISHPGVTNGFLVATKSKLSITYSDDSILERMHLAELYRILAHEKYDVFHSFNKEEKMDTRKLIIQMVLATDLSRHFSHISKLKSRNFVVAEDKSMGLEVVVCMETILMLADLGHCAKPFSYHFIWANRIAEEFFRQGEAEERNGLPISPLCDRKQSNLPKSQGTFLTMLATPLYDIADEAFGFDEFDQVKYELHNNIMEWTKRVKTESAMMTIVEPMASAASGPGHAAASSASRAEGPPAISNASK